MKNKKIVSCVFIILLGLFGFSTNAVSDTEMQAAILANPCAGCHGTDGKSTGPIPAIDSLSATYISSAMKAFKSGKRPGSVMNRIAKGYTDQEIDLMATHFENANQK